MYRSSLVFAGLIAAVLGTAVPGILSTSRLAMAQSGVLAELYGSGVHAYYSHDYAKAYELLSRSIDGGINDPRAYYFRGLTSMATGRPDEAEGDFHEGARIEALGTFGPAIGRALTRVQGAQRMQIERIRQQARLDYQAEAAAQAQRRYSEAQAAEAQVLRGQPRSRTAPPLPGRRPPAQAQAAPAPAAPVPAAPAPARTAPAVVPSPFDDDAMAGGEATVESPDALEDTLIDPFADDVAAPPAAAGQPAAAEPAAPADPFAAPEGGTDPFAAPPAEDDPFGANPFGS